MGKLRFKILVILCVISFALISFSCESSYYKWKYDSKEQAYVQKTTGTLKYKYQLNYGSLDIVVKYYPNSDPIYSTIKIQTKDRYFRKKDIHLYLANFKRLDKNKNREKEVEEINKKADRFKVRRDVNDFEPIYFNYDDVDTGVRTRSFSKDKQDSSVLVLNNIISEDMYLSSTVGHGGGCDIEFIDGDYTYTFRIYGKGAI